ncbi:MAG: DUF4296 domain-containing protein [Chitinophagaceae bacterium]
MRSHLKIFIAVCLLSACKSVDSYQVLSEREMQYVIWDLLRANGLSQAEILKMGKTESLLEDARKYEQVFSSYGLNREAFMKSYAYYAARPDQLKVIMDSVSNMAIRYGEEIQRVP